MTIKPLLNSNTAADIPTGRRGYLMELDPAYVDVTIQRYQNLTGKTANHAAAGVTFAHTQTVRAEKEL